jgi:hypothetical protein
MRRNRFATRFDRHSGRFGLNFRTSRKLEKRQRNGACRQCPVPEAGLRSLYGDRFSGFATQPSSRDPCSRHRRCRGFARFDRAHSERSATPDRFCVCARGSGRWTVPTEENGRGGVREGAPVAAARAPPPRLHQRPGGDPVRGDRLGGLPDMEPALDPRPHIDPAPARLRLPRPSPARRGTGARRPPIRRGRRQGAQRPMACRTLAHDRRPDASPRPDPAPPAQGCVSSRSNIDPR